MDGLFGKDKEKPRAIGFPDKYVVNDRYLLRSLGRFKKIAQSIKTQRDMHIGCVFSLRPVIAF